MALDRPTGDIKIRPATAKDRLAINNLINFENHSHRHMDWRMPLDWIGHSPFFVAERHGQVAAVLACPPDPQEVAWIRAFASAPFLDIPEVWNLLWHTAMNELRNMDGVKYAVSIALENWYRNLLRASGFQFETHVILLSWENRLHPVSIPPVEGQIRLMADRDLEAIHQIDRQAFEPIWRYSPSAIKLSHEQSTIATVVEQNSRIIGYQVSTPSPLGGHLARLAVSPLYQGRGIGYVLIQDLLSRFKNRGAMRVTVNTQENNISSKRLYAKTNFHETGEKYPVYKISLSEGNSLQ